MAQIIRHRRGSLEALSAVTSSLVKGELVIASGSSNLTVTNGSSLVFAVPENGQVQATNRFLIGDAAPNTFAGSTYNGLVKGVPYYASGSSTLYLLGTDGNEAINLVGNIQPFSSSVAASINALSSSIGSGTIGNSVTLLNSFTGSQETKDSTLATYTASVDSRLSQLETVSGSNLNRLSNLETTSASVNTSVSNLNSFTQSFSQSVATDFSASNASITSLSASVASVTGDFSSSVATSFSASAASQTVLSQSISTSFATVASEQSEQDARLTSLENVTGSYATTGSNIFYGTQTITGSLFITQNLVVQGSSSLQNITASAVDIGTNTVLLNTAAPAVRFGGVSVQDSGSFSGISGSLLWDSFNNHWLYVQPSGSGEEYNSAILIAGPKNTGALGDEATITSGSIQVGLGENHIGDSIMTQNVGATKITIAGGLDVTGNISGSIVGIGNVAAFSQSVDSRLDSVEASLGGGGSIGTRVAALETFSGSQEEKDSTLATYTASVDSNISAIHSFTSSQEEKDSTLATYTASVDSALTNLINITGSYATTGSNVFVASQTISGSLIVTDVIQGTGSIFLQPDVNDVRKLEIYNTSVTDVHIKANGGQTFLGDDTNYVLVDDSLQTITIESANGVTVDTLLNVTGELSASTINGIGNVTTYSASVDSRFSASVANVLSLSASVASVTGDFSSSVAQTFTTQSARISSLESFSGSQETKNSTLSTYTASIDGNIANIHAFTSSFGTTFSSSVDSRLDTLEGTGTIQGVGTGNNVTFAKVTTTGDVVVGGDLVVQGNTVTLNTATLVVEDKLITLASGSTSSATADGAGFEVAGAGANFIYQHSTTAFTSSVALIAPSVTSSINLGSTAGSSKRIAFRNTNGNLDLVAEPTTSGDLLQWNGTDFVMSNTIDGGSF
jgi:hypothetical protein